jgi:hypothetical protein
MLLYRGMAMGQPTGLVTEMVSATEKEKVTGKERGSAPGPVGGPAKASARPKASG